MRVLMVLLGALALPVHAQAELSPQEVDRVIEHVCGEEQSISAPEQYLWQTECNYRFTYGGGQFWISYVHTLDLREASCPTQKPWCVKPERLLLAVSWPGTGTPDREEVIAEELWGTTPSFATKRTEHGERESVFYAARELSGPFDSPPGAHLGTGHEHRAYWNERFEEILRLVLARAQAQNS